MAEVLQVEKRDWTGKRRVRRQRAEGRIPAVLYGHGEEVVHLSAAQADLATAIRHGSQLVDLAGAGALDAAVQLNLAAVDQLPPLFLSHVCLPRQSAQTHRHPLGSAW